MVKFNSLKAESNGSWNLALGQEDPSKCTKHYLVGLTLSAYYHYLSIVLTRLRQVQQVGLDHHERIIGELRTTRAIG